MVRAHTKGAAYSRLKVFSNLSKQETSIDNLIVKEGINGSCMPHPIQEEIVHMLRKGFGDIAIFFWNAQYGSEIGVLWKPAYFLTKKFSILETRNKLAMVSTENKATTVTVINTSEITAQMLKASNGMLSRINFL